MRACVYEPVCACACVRAHASAGNDGILRHGSLNRIWANPATREEHKQQFLKTLEKVRAVCACVRMRVCVCSVCVCVCVCVGIT